MSTITDTRGTSRHAAGAPASQGGQFAPKRSAAHRSPLVPDGRAAFLDAVEAAREAQDNVRREAVREMRRVAPAGADLIVFELYNEGDVEAELFAYQGVLGVDGEQLPIDRGVQDCYWELSAHIDPDTAEELGFARDGEVFTLDVTEPTSR